MQDDARAVRSLFARRPASAPVRRTETGVHSTKGTREPATPKAASQFVDLKADLHARVIADLQEDKGRALADQIGGAFCKVDVTNTDDIVEVRSDDREPAVAGSRGQTDEIGDTAGRVYGDDPNPGDHGIVGRLVGQSVVEHEEALGSELVA